jgi:hypothetical protein
VVPTSVVALAIIVIAVLPGSMYTWAFERQVTAYGVTLADRVLRFIAISLIFHVILGWGEYWLFRAAFAGEDFGGRQFAAAWVAILFLVAIPLLAGTTTGGLYATRNNRDEHWTWLRRGMTQDREDRLLGIILGRTPAPRAWDNLFSERPTIYLRVETTDGTPLGGRFADNSYAGGFPNEPDLFLEEEWSLDENGNLKEALGYPVYIPSGQIARMEIVPQQGEENAT